MSRTDSIVKMVQFQCTDPDEQKQIEDLFQRLYGGVQPELDSGDGRQVVRCLVAGIRLAHVAALMMGMTDEGAFHCVADTLKMRITASSKAREQA